HTGSGSVVEFLNVMGPLAHPRAYGDDPSDAFHVVAPSIPGFGLSGPTHDPGWDPGRIARAFSVLMRRLNYPRYGAYGDGFGAVVARELGVLDAEHVVGVHVTQRCSFSSGTSAAPAAVPDDEPARRGPPATVTTEGQGSEALQPHWPQTLAYALTDSPIGQLAWVVDWFRDDATRLPEDPVDRDRILTNVMLHWLTGTAAPSLVHWSELDHGGHFPAIEAPDLLVADLRAYFRRFR